MLDYNINDDDDDNSDKKSKRECLFSLQRMNKYYLFPFLVPLVCFSTKFFSEPMKTNDGKIKNVKDVSEENSHTFTFLYQMINSTSLIFGGLLYFITILRNGLDNKTNDSKNLVVEKCIENIKHSKKRSKSNDILIIVFMSLIISVYNILKGYNTKYPTLEKRLYFLFFITLINVYIFKKQIYKHQKFSLGLGFIGIVFIFTIFFVFLDYNKYEYIYDILLFFGAFLYSLYLVLVKYMSEIRFYSPFLLLLLIGIFSTILSVVGYMIFSYIYKGDFRYITNIFHCRDDMYVCFGNFYVQIIIYFLINTLLQILIFLVCYYFSPEVFAISDIISPFLSFILSICEGKITNAINIIFTAIGYIIIIFASFIYNEIIVCNFWGLNEKTWKAIDKKAEEDYLGEEEGSRNVTIGDFYVDNHQSTLRMTNSISSSISYN